MIVIVLFGIVIIVVVSVAVVIVAMVIVFVVIVVVTYSSCRFTKLQLNGVFLKLVFVIFFSAVTEFIYKLDIR